MSKIGFLIQPNNALSTVSKTWALNQTRSKVQKMCHLSNKPWLLAIFRLKMMSRVLKREALRWMRKMQLWIPLKPILRSRTSIVSTREKSSKSRMRMMKKSLVRLPRVHLSLRQMWNLPLVRWHQRWKKMKRFQTLNEGQIAILLNILTRDQRRAPYSLGSERKWRTQKKSFQKAWNKILDPKSHWLKSNR